VEKQHNSKKESTCHYPKSAQQISRVSTERAGKEVYGRGLELAGETTFKQGKSRGCGMRHKGDATFMGKTTPRAGIVVEGRDIWWKRRGMVNQWICEDIGKR